MDTKEILQYVKNHPSGKVKIAITDIDGSCGENIFLLKNFFPSLNLEPVSAM